MSALEHIKQVYGLCASMEDREWLEEGFSKFEKKEVNDLTEADKMLLALIRDNIPLEGSILIIGAEYHHLAGYLRMMCPARKIDTWPSLKMLSEFCLDDIGVVFTSEWRKLQEADKTIWKQGTEIWCLFKEEEVREIYNSLIYEGFIPEEKNISKIGADLEGKSVFFMRATYAPVEAEDNNMARQSVFRKIYAISPAGVKSGGPELMHQLVYHLTRMGADANIVYAVTDETEAAAWCHPDYKKYVSGRICRIEDIDFSNDNVMVIPESWPIFLKYTGNMEKIFWWLSVDNFINVYGKNDPKMPEYEQEVVNSSDLMLYQSEYARRFALSIGADEKKLKHLGDYLNLEYTENSNSFLGLPKDRIVAYNPKKGKEFTRMLIEAGKDITWVPIENMTTREVRELLCRARVYIDFGEHPGKDRIPREAAMCGCCIITGRKGAAAFREDVNIPDRYRIDENKASVDEILGVIKNLLDDYNERVSDYAEYREGILEEREEFIMELGKIFFR